MNAKKLIAAVTVFAAAGSALADSTFPYVDFSGFKSTKTRAEVTAELKDARASGNYVVGGREYVQADANFASTKTRAQVLNELKQAQANGTYVVGGEEYEGQIPVTARRTGRVANATEIVRNTNAADVVTSN
jgi:hypothetical protein